MRKTFAIATAITLFISSCQSNNTTEENQTTTTDTTLSAASVEPDGDVAPSAKRLIDPGVSAGNTYLNQPLQVVQHKLGEPDEGDAAMGKSISVWYAHHDTAANTLSIFASTQMGVDDTARVKQIRITSPWFETKNGAHAGMPLDSLEDKYQLKEISRFKDKGQPVVVYETNQGIAFEVNSQKICRAIIVYEKDKKLTDGYFVTSNTR